MRLSLSRGTACDSSVPITAAAWKHAERHNGAGSVFNATGHPPVPTRNRLRGDR
jgi:hypothetical protein